MGDGGAGPLEGGAAAVLSPNELLNQLLGYCGGGDGAAAVRGLFAWHASMYAINMWFMCGARICCCWCALKAKAWLGCPPADMRYIDRQNICRHLLRSSV